jgi:CheY-like chemotaxis protein
MTICASCGRPLASHGRKAAIKSVGIGRKARNAVGCGPQVTSNSPVRPEAGRKGTVRSERHSGKGTLATARKSSRKTTRQFWPARITWRPGPLPGKAADRSQQAPERKDRTFRRSARRTTPGNSRPVTRTDRTKRPPGKSADPVRELTPKILAHGSGLGTADVAVQPDRTVASEGLIEKTTGQVAANPFMQTDDLSLVPGRAEEPLDAVVPATDTAARAAETEASSAPSQAEGFQTELTMPPAPQPNGPSAPDRPLDNGPGLGGPAATSALEAWARIPTAPDTPVPQREKFQAKLRLHIEPGITAGRAPELAGRLEQPLDLDRQVETPSEVQWTVEHTTHLAGQGKNPRDLEPLPKKKVLVIDDDPTLRMLLKMGLAPHGYDCVTAENGKAAQPMLQTNRPDLILVDLLMPVMDGLAFIQWLRQKAKDSTPVLVLTNVDDPKITKEALKSGANSFAYKPVRLKDLLAAIKKLVPA